MIRVSRSPRVALAAFVAYAILAIAGWLALPRDTFWINDNGLKYLQMRAILDSPDGSSAILPGIPESETGGLLPIPRMVLKPVGGEYHILYPVSFARIAAWASRLGGDTAARLLPLLAGLLGVFLWTLCAGMVAPRRAGWIPVLALASPWMFYHWVFWEHSLTLVIVALSLYICLYGVRRNVNAAFLVSGFVMAIGSFLRLEMLIVAFALFLGVAFLRGGWRRPVLFAVGTGMGAMMLFVSNQMTWGHPLGLHYSGVQEANVDITPGSRFDTVANVLVGMTNHPVIIVLVMGALVAVSCVAGTKRRSVYTVALLGYLAAHVMMRALLLGYVDPYLALLEFGGFVATSPIFPLALLAGALSWNSLRRGDGITRLLILMAASYLLLAALTCPHITSIGIHFGPRILLPAYVPLGLLAARHLVVAGRLLRRGPRALAVCILLLIAIGLADSVCSWMILRAQLTRNARVAAVLRERREQLIVTDVFWFTPIHATLFGTKDFLYVDSARRDGFPRAIEYAGTHSVPAFLYATSPRFQPGPMFEPIPMRGIETESTIMDIRLYRLEIEGSN